MKVYGYYHRDDLDGQFSAAVMKKKYPEIELWGMDYGDENIPLAKDYDIIIMSDISMPRDKMEFLKDNNKQLLWFDHHKGTIEDIESHLGKIDGIRDTGNMYSGCVLTWKGLFPDRKIPYILEIIQDLDLWKFRIPETSPITLALEMDHRMQIVYFMDMLNNSEETKNELLSLQSTGEIYINMREHIIDKAIKDVTLMNWNGYNVGLVNAHMFKSHIGNALLDENDVIQVAMIWHMNKGKIKISLRSRGNIDVSVIAGKYDGGGHKAASGFVCETIDDFLCVLDKEE